MLKSCYKGAMLSITLVAVSGDISAVMEEGVFREQINCEHKGLGGKLTVPL